MIEKLEIPRDPGFERSRNRAGLLVFGSIILLVALLLFSIRLRGSHVLLNVSYDASVGFFHTVDPLFHAEQPKFRVNTSHAGSVAQGLNVIRGLKADVVTLASAAEVDAISEAGFIRPDWRLAFPHESSPFTSAVVFLVRAGNPKGIADWDDLIRRDVNVVIPSAEVSGAGRWAYLSAWLYAQERDPAEGRAEQFVRELYAGRRQIEKGARATLVSFMAEGSGDVLVTWESEAWHAFEKHGPQQVEIVYPSVSILAEPVVAIVDRSARQRNTLGLAKDYLDFLYSDEGQKAAVQNYLRPRKGNLPLWSPGPDGKTRLVPIANAFGSWKNALETHFSERGSYRRIRSSVNSP